MVQAALIPAIGAAIGSGASALGAQQRREISRGEMPSVAIAMAQATNPKQQRELKKAAEADRLYYLLTQPEFIGMLLTIGGIYASNKIKFDDNAVTNEGLQAISTMTSVLIGLGYAGVGDLTTLLAATVAGGISLADLMNNIIPDLNLLPDVNVDFGDIDWLDWLKNINPMQGLVNWLT